jgi:tetratricopeptide (TPR) repeat protein
LVNWLIATIDRQTIMKAAGWGDPSELPVFVVGMPRSGTSLVEQIAASHPSVFGAGEQTDLPRMLTALSGAEAACSPLMWDPVAVRCETASYIRKLREFDSEAERIIDKQPDNILLLGQIAMLFPRARIVVCRRDPRDVCLSCYFQYFQDDKVSWADDLADCGFRAQQIERLMDHWRAVLPTPVLEIQYETLISDPERESRRLIDYLGVDWDPACLSFHETERIVTTASRWQVRQPLYTSSVGRWRNYRRHLNPLFAELADLLPEVDRDLAKRPGEAMELAGLSRTHRAASDAKAAVEAARRAVALDPALPDARMELGLGLLMLQDDAGAVEALRSAIELVPGSLEAQIAFATALSRRKDHPSAEEAWQAALSLKPDDPGLLIEHAGTLTELERFDEALAIYRRAETMLPGNARAQHGIASILVRTGDVAGAAETCRRALEKAPDFSPLWLLLGHCEAAQGHFAAATLARRRALALDPGSIGALHDLVGSGDRLNDDATGDTVRNVLGDQTQRVRDRIAAGFTLGRISDHRGDHDEAFAAYTLANELLRAERAAHGFVFDLDADHRLMDWLIATIGPRTFAETAGWGDPSKLPVFVVGMPRSGTSLVEQIAASHGLVHGAGERKDIAGILSALGGGQMGKSPSKWDPASVRRETAAHVRMLHHLSGGAARIIDKLPLNIVVLGQIAVLFPGARIVVCRRDPRDVSLSCFFQYFQEDAMPWTDSLEDCGFRVREIDRLMTHWREVLPLPFLEIDYETLVGNLEAESRRLIDFLGLDWDPACLSFHKTERTVTTASLWQVRQPLYASSVGRWRHYRRHLGPLFRELKGLVPADER